MNGTSSRPEQYANDRSARPASRSLLSTVGRAAAYGVAWGAAARVWMRYISEDPEFTIAGTSFIVGVPTLICLCSVLAKRCLAWRALARRPARAVAGFSTVLLGTAAGILMMPTLVLGGVAWAHRTRLPKVLLGIIYALACAPILAVIQEIPSRRMVTALPAYLLLVATFIPVYARIYHPSGTGSPK